VYGRPGGAVATQFPFAGGRLRDGRPVQGLAIARPAGFGGGEFSFPLFSSGFGWGSGFFGYNSYYGNTRWSWGRYGMWYDPFDPWGYYDPYGYGYCYGYGANAPYGGSSSASSNVGSQPTERTGSVRLKASPVQARVYVDGTLMGIVDDFDGLSGHLDLIGGTHQLELRADGYETVGVPITVSVGKTTTARLSLKKKK
jgi:PEGA domain